jgi:pyruvate/2-oxoglutarate dehydrogenase complex dihydrolipoamide dehydrogenase (E3) component
MTLALSFRIIGERNLLCSMEKSFFVVCLLHNCECKAQKIGMNRTEIVLSSSSCNQTSDPSIYAAGDCIEGWHMVNGKKIVTALATHSNRNGRLIGRNIHFGNVVPFLGSLNTFGTEVFGTTVVSIGITERAAREEGIEVLSVIRKGTTRKKMFHGEDFWAKVIADPDRQTLLGAQLLGPREVSRIGERIIVMIGEEIPLSKISQYENIFSPPLSNPYDLITNEGDILISELLKVGKSVKW